MSSHKPSKKQNFNNCEYDHQDQETGKISYVSENNKENQTNEPVKDRSSIALGRAIILQAIIDCVSCSKRTEDKLARIDALKWFDINNRDFLIICSLSEWSPNWVLKKQKKALMDSNEWKRNQKDITV